MSEYLLGHKKSPYYTKKEPERREIYAKSCERHLTYLDYSVIDKKLKDEQSELEALKARVEKQEKDLAEYNSIPPMLEQMQIEAARMIEFAKTQPWYDEKMEQKWGKKDTASSGSQPT